MKIINTIHEIRCEVAEAKSKGLTAGVVPTMGCLHDGHLALMKHACEDCGFVIVTIFVNPTQFGPSEDFARYPRDLERDAALCREAGVDLVFAPEVAEMYPAGYSTYVNVEGITNRLEGASRPGHFRGVATVVAKLFNIVQADRAYFGQKDYQQLQVVRRMTADLNLPVEIIAVPTVREPDGIAMSSRNTYLSSEERCQAVVLSQSLELAARMFASGERDADAIKKAVREKIESAPLARIDYVSAADPDTLEELSVIERSAVISLAVFFGKTRLIDNRVIGVQSEGF